jgi:hypothetical protein
MSNFDDVDARDDVIKSRRFTGTTASQHTVG